MTHCYFNLRDGLFSDFWWFWVLIRRPMKRCGHTDYHTHVTREGQTLVAENLLIERMGKLKPFNRKWFDRPRR